MTKRGPKTVPTGLKLVTGTSRPHRENPGEPKPEVAIPEAPKHLNSHAHEEWVRIAVNGGVKTYHCGGAKSGQFGVCALERAALI